MPSPPNTSPTTIDEGDLTKEEPIKNSTIEELKSKLGVSGENEDGTKMIPDTQKNNAREHNTSGPLFNEDGLIMPRKPPNPVKENHERQNLHRELLFNQKIGKNVLNQKSELQRALDRQKEQLAKKEMEISVGAHAPELEKVIADRAKRLQENSNHTKNEDDDKGINEEFVRARMKLKNRSDSK